MTWINNYQNTWWKILGSEYHPKCIIYQEPTCFRCSKKYNKYYNLNYNSWKTIYNKLKKIHEEKIYCLECALLLKQEINVTKNIIQREITGRYILGNK